MHLSLSLHVCAGYNYSGSALAAIFLSAVLGLLVSLSTFLVIGATSSLTYNVIGHVKVLQAYSSALSVSTSRSAAHRPTHVCHSSGHLPS